jgi:branched-chain amino acid transport system substrate-binding protein
MLDGRDAELVAFVRRYPGHAKAGEVLDLLEVRADDRAFGEASAAGTRVAFEAYLRERPNGRHRGEATERLAALAPPTSAPPAAVSAPDPAPTAVPAGPIVVATAGPMSGQYASFGAQMKAGAQQAVADINAAGGILGRQVVLEVGDDLCEPSRAVAVAKELSKTAQVVAGHFCSGASIPASRVYDLQGVVQISPASTNPKFTDDRPGPSIFRVSGRDDAQGAVAGKYIADKYRGRNVAILHDKSVYGKGLADEARRALNSAGVREKMYEAYTANEKDYTALVVKMKAANIHVVYLGGYHVEGALILRQMRERGLKAPMLSGDAFNTEEFWSITGPAGAGTMFTFAPDPRNFPSAAEAVRRFQAKGINPEGYTLYTYAALQVFKQAAERAGSTASASVTAAMQDTEFDTVLGKLRFDAKGDVTGSDYVWYVWKDGRYSQM